MKTVDIKTASDLLRKGEVVAIPTETVYGLGASINSEEGLKKIFSTKERPFFDPLIVHVADTTMAKTLTTNWTSVHEVLAQSAWPGPLTLIADRAPSVNPLITSGLESVGIRCPDHALTLELLREVGGVAAPSANKFGKTSPTTAEHVFQEFGDNVVIIDGGPCRVGIESTVAGVKGNRVEIYRPGFFTQAMLREILLKSGLECEVVYAESPVAPGQLKHHYMPRIPLVIVSADFEITTDMKKVESALGKKIQHPILWNQAEKPDVAARELYESLRRFDQEGYDVILTRKLPFHDHEDWRGIWNRLEKAKSATA